MPSPEEDNENTPFMLYSFHRCGKRPFGVFLSPILRSTLCAILFLFHIHLLQAQETRGFLNLATTQYNGDLSYDAFSSARLRPALAIGVERSTQGRFSLIGQLLYGRLGASDRFGLNADRNLAFETALWEVSLMGRLQFPLAEDRRIVPYAIGGIAGFHVDPYSEVGGDKVRLFPLTTQGQGLAGHPGSGPNPKNYLAIPLGAGLDLRLNDWWRVDIELVMRKTFTDNIDDVGGIYPDRSALLAARGAMAVSVSYRGGGAFPAKGSLRGNPSDDDWYASFGIRFKTPLSRKKPLRPIPPPVTPLATLLPDRDGDGIPDEQDQCPQVAGSPKYAGCPVPDSDRDGINDDKDRCPFVSGNARYEGCPIPDTDKDGINDEQDKCLTLPGSAKYDGCPVPDTDGDGLNDETDRCPSFAGIPSLEGCPLPPVQESLLQFVARSATLTAAAKAELNRFATWILKKEVRLHVRIIGVPQPAVTAEAANLLADKRAAAVMGYLITRGVSSDRLEYVILSPDAGGMGLPIPPPSSQSLVVRFLITEKR